MSIAIPHSLPGSGSIASPQRPIDACHVVELGLLLCQQGELGIPQAVLLIQPGLHPGGTGQETGACQPLGLPGIGPLLLQIAQPLIPLLTGCQAILHFQQRGIELLAKLGFGNLVVLRVG